MGLDRHDDEDAVIDVLSVCCFSKVLWPVSCTSLYGTWVVHVLFFVRTKNSSKSQNFVLFDRRPYRYASGLFIASRGWLRCSVTIIHRAT
jgi:hypothetical protein